MKKRVWTAIPIYFILVIVMALITAVSYIYLPLYISISFSVLSLASLILVLNYVLRFQSYMNKTIDNTLRSLYDIPDKYIDQIKSPTCIIGNNNEIILFNTKFKRTFFNGKNALNEVIFQIVPEDTLSHSFQEDYSELSFNRREYYLFTRKVSEGILLTFIDITYLKKIERYYDATRKSVAIAVFDNFDDFNNDSEDEAMQATIQIESVLQKWANSSDSLYRKLSDSRYMIIFDDFVLKTEISNKFEILDAIRNIKYNDRSATISVGIGRGFDSLKESQIMARKALDMALGRGGDQVAVLYDNEYTFFGGVSKGVEKTNNVRVRAIAESMKNMINDASNVFIMGHTASDLDCIGSASGIYSFVVKKFEKECYIVVDKERSLAKPMIEYLSKNDDDKFISADHALSRVNENSLLFIVDTHSPNFVESKKLYESCHNIIVVDHHRKMVDYIENAGQFFHSPNASSTAEMVTELCRYLGDDTLNRIEAEALLAGIMLDTKNFILRTGVNTFEAAAYLRKKGADTITVSKAFANTFESYVIKSELVAKAEMIGNFAVTVSDKMIKNSRVVCAQAADDLLTIQDIYASFVISNVDTSTVNISARSTGKVNVQVIMENLGGGGHQTMAATQLKNISLEEAKQKLIKELKKVEVVK